MYHTFCCSGERQKNARKTSKKGLTIPRDWGKIVKSLAKSERQRSRAIGGVPWKLNNAEMNHRYDSSQMSIKRNLDETSIVNYICKKQSTISLCGSKESYPKIKRANHGSLQTAKWFSLPRLSCSPKRRKKRRDFCARQGMAKPRPADVLVYVEDTRRSHDAA